MPTEPSAPKTAIEALLQPHLDALAVKQYSQQTIKTRREQLGAFVRWCAHQGLANPQEITRPALEQYQRHLFNYRKRNDQPLSLRTQYGMLVPLRVWFRWMTRENCVPHTPALDLELPRIGHYLPRHVLNVAGSRACVAETKPIDTHRTSRSCHLGDSLFDRNTARRVCATETL